MGGGPLVLSVSPDVRSLVGGLFVCFVERSFAPIVAHKERLSGRMALVRAPEDTCD
jgi:hypothetical protein